jgi:hypothetical protein
MTNPSTRRSISSCSRSSSPPMPSPDDVELLRSILAAIDAVPPRTKSTTLEKSFAKVLPSNKNERDNLVALFGYCGILATLKHPGYLRQFVPDAARPQDSEMNYPACWWRRSDGISQPALKFWFGHLL